ncbi:uncharacterized protein DNG_01582 [Cephalotrichum gorgonifer]|uniref:Ras domain-containing protein n=1 Tax=Cephalotrichum gorgonifer TaxID=2041049 RepID=A0AAE8MTH4_9PEZI|nr:uncharacterized protein DNG_01582 [Cephalotrichum gorgonifer]
MTPDMPDDEDARAHRPDSYSYEYEHGSQTTSSHSLARQSRPDTLFTHDSSQVFFSPDLSATTANSRPVSGISCLPSPTFRDSIISIVDDPFFQKLRDVGPSSDRADADDENEGAEADDRAPASVDAQINEEVDDYNKYENWEAAARLGKQQKRLRERPLKGSARNADADDNNLDTGGFHGAAGENSLRARYKRPPPCRDSLTIGQFQPATGLPHWTTYAAMESLNIAIIGARGVGKSSFVQRILGLSRPPISNSSSLRIVIDQHNYAVTLLELDLEHFDMAPSQPIQWPKQINGHILPRVDGALILYDVTNKETIMDLPKTLSALTSSSLPSILVACKCDASENARQVDADGMANHDLFKACVANYNISSNKPEHSRACLNTIIRTVIANRRGR